jgi:hypothetical protein
MALCQATGNGPDTNSATLTFHADSLEGLEFLNAKANLVTYQGRPALHLAPQPQLENSDEDVLALLPGSDFKDGTIEAEVAGSPRVGAPEDARGFIGIAFRVESRGSRFEIFYLRPTNGRADDQLRRNHSVQYQSSPDFPWHRLRKETPGVYEAYCDLEAGAWTKMKITVSGHKAQLYINGASQPCLVVNDLKLGDARGRIALWAHPTTDAYFSELSVKKSN